MAYTLEAGGLTKAFRGRPVLGGLDLQAGPGEVLALLGPNGAGKTTTVRILGTLLRPDGGDVRVAGLDVRTHARAVRRVISLTGQQTAVDDVLTGRENLVMMGRLRHLSAASARTRAAELLDRFGLTEAADRRVSTYSGGMARKLDLALSVVVPPRVLFLDEPTTGLDPAARREVWDHLGELTGSGVTVLLTTQYLEEADHLADRICVLAGGRIVAQGSAHELKARIAGEVVRLVFDSPATLGSATRSLSTRFRADEARLAIDVPTDGSAAAVAELLTRLTAAGAAAARVELHRATLDDVFLELTAEHRGAAA
ncbi:ATP-binding cassette domain-containing protein [Kineococcus sp. SYSU DK003]|uniref:ATP-binding cassette domain-containing protein n=1 Tax=Kineococcus sp. SYSU DK003 TaxID=3383124 RepID=UPI003D7F03AF